jgi:alkylation response protein AidB-like acyl-CoA dehydrogenase
MRALRLSEDERLLATSARELLDAAAPVSRFRALRDAGQSIDAPLWAQAQELGWTLISGSQADGGLGLGLAGLAVVAEEVGRTLALLPLSALAVSAATGGHAADTTLAWRERATSRDPRSTSATLLDGRLTGAKRDVPDLGVASSVWVPAMGAHGLVVARVERGASGAWPEGMTARRQARVDGRDRWTIALDGVVAAPADLGERELCTASRWVQVLTCAEALGATQAVFAKTIAWLKERRQFGVPIGSFQVLQHRAVDLYARLELASVLVRQAAITGEPADVARAVRRVPETAMKVAKEAVQMHGGIGVTEECDVGLYLKAAMGAAAELGGG